MIFFAGVTLFSDSLTLDLAEFNMKYYYSRILKLNLSDQALRKVPSIQGEYLICST